MIKLIIFDVDGTLVDAYRAIEKSLCHTMEKLGYGRCASLAVVRQSIGHGDRNFVKLFLDDENVEKGLAIYRRHHRSALMAYSRAMPGARRVLAALRKRGYRLAVASNRPKNFTLILLRHLGLDRSFDMVVCARDARDFKPKPALLLRVMRRLGVRRGETLYVGDMAVDVIAGRNAGVRTVAVTGGSSSVAELRSAKPFRVIAKLSHLLRVLEKP
ncbi:MAG: HAD family hydrolase [Candidatus Omnitrophica bacterium]|nr:HAD family hydrolase [Candidatus Omnitrophota bacterium]